MALTIGLAHGKRSMYNVVREDHGVLEALWGGTVNPAQLYQFSVSGLKQHICSLIVLGVRNPKSVCLG